MDKGKLDVDLIIYRTAEIADHLRGLTLTESEKDCYFTHNRIFFSNSIFSRTTMAKGQQPTIYH
jgi:hypothetical protein